MLACCTHSNSKARPVHLCFQSGTSAAYIDFVLLTLLMPIPHSLKATTAVKLHP
jgi:hypothetical protein